MKSPKDSSRNVSLMLSRSWLWLHLSLMYHKPMSPPLEVRTNNISSFLQRFAVAFSCDDLGTHYMAGLLPTAAGDTGSLLKLVFDFGFSPGMYVTFLILRLVNICRLLCRQIIWHATKSILSALPSDNKTNQWESLLVRISTLLQLCWAACRVPSILRGYTPKKWLPG